MRFSTMQMRMRPRFVIDAVREDEYVIWFGSIRARRPLRRLAARDRQELLRSAAAHLEAMAEEMRAEAVELDG
jgi:hypothetical protein